ncbi:hypothetical protein MHYP_G00195870 [Metynnis hypsauchen]
MLIVLIKVKMVKPAGGQQWERGTKAVEKPHWLLIFLWSDGLVFNDRQSHTRIAHLKKIPALPYSKETRVEDGSFQRKKRQNGLYFCQLPSVWARLCPLYSSFPGPQLSMHLLLSPSSSGHWPFLQVPTAPTAAAQEPSAGWRT